jgi:hypothetical protein
MIQKRNRSNNPLTLITFFGGIPLVSIYAVKYINMELQYLYICLVMGYLLLLTILTFLLLLFKPEVLYSPSDFKNEENFIKTMKFYKQIKKDKER